MEIVRRKIIVIFVILLLFISLGNTSSYATIQSMFPGEVGNAQDGIDSTKSLLSSILGIVRIVGITVAVVMLAVIACKYMTSAPGDRADLKKYIPIYVTGALVLFGASGLVGIIRNMVFEATGN